MLTGDVVLTARKPHRTWRGPIFGALRLWNVRRREANVGASNTDAPTLPCQSHRTWPRGLEPLIAGARRQPRDQREGFNFLIS